MTFKTKLRDIWKNPVHAAWIVLAMLEIGVFVEFYSRFVLQSTSLRGVFRWARPPLPKSLLNDIRLLWWSYMCAGGVRVSEGISAFSGKLIRGIWTPQHTLVVVSMLLSYIVAPSLFLWGMRARKEWSGGKPAKHSAFTILAATAIGGYILFFSLLTPLKTFSSSWSMWQHMKADSYSNSLRDAAISSVSVLGFQAEQLRLMPEANGGGAWRNGPGGITIADIDTVLPRLERGLWEPGTGAAMKYFLEVRSPDSLTIWGIANAHGEWGGINFRNKDGSTGNVQVHAGVTPERVTTGMDN